MRGIVYVSEAKVYFDRLSLDGLAADCAARNFDAGVTGYLYFEKDRFIQYIEGDKETIDSLFDTISRDPRHTVLHHVTDDGFDERRFPSWHMRSLSSMELMQCKVEDFLSEYLVYLDSLSAGRNGGDERWRNVVWGMVNRLSSMRGQLRFD